MSKDNDTPKLPNRGASILSYASENPEATFMAYKTSNPANNGAHTLHGLMETAERKMNAMQVDKSSAMTFEIDDGISQNATTEGGLRQSRMTRPR